ACHCLAHGFYGVSHWLAARLSVVPLNPASKAGFSCTIKEASNVSRKTRKNYTSFLFLLALTIDSIQIESYNQLTE
ncbi:MAG: hypothetical protein LLG02_16025, partial [Pelosinus sp.]|nr:hypothetical protein [Pelosinus sp.]